MLGGIVVAYANLLETLDRESKLDNMLIYGNIRCAIDKPSFLSNSITLEDGFFALVDVLALRCNGVDYFSESSDFSDSNHIYFSKGSIVIVANDRSLIGKNVKIYGRTSKGCTIKRQKTDNSRDGIVAFAWTKSGGNWCIVPNKILPFGEADARGTVLEDYIVSLVNGIPFVHPDYASSFAEYYGFKDAKPLDKQDITGGFDYSTDKIDLSQIPLNLVHRLKASPRSEFTDVVGEAVEALTNSSKNYSKSIIYSIKRGIEEEENSNTKSIDTVAKNIVYSFVNNIVVVQKFDE